MPTPTLRPLELSYPFEGFGTSLAWWANHLGSGLADPFQDSRGPSAVENLLQKLFAGPDEGGIDLSCVRYNVGGTTDPDRNANFREGANVLTRVAEEDPQMRVLRRIMEIRRGRPLHIEVFSNSPPQDLTISGSTAGHSKRLRDNIRLKDIPKFAYFLVDSVSTLLNAGIPVDSLSPINEPSEPVWIVGNNQEGCYWSPRARTALAQELRMLMNASGGIASRGVLLALAEENNIAAAAFHLDFTKRANILNVHTYTTDQFSPLGIVKWYSKNIQDAATFRSRIRKTAQARKQPLAVSEFGLGGPHLSQNIRDVGSHAFALVHHAIRDIVTLGAIRWVYWQAVENAGSNWGLLQIPFSSPSSQSLSVGAQYHALGMLVRAIPVGTRRVDAWYDKTRVCMVNNEVGRVLIARKGAPKRDPEIEWCAPELHDGWKFTAPLSGTFNVQRLVNNEVGEAVMLDLGVRAIVPSTVVEVPEGCVEIWERVDTSGYEFFSPGRLTPVGAPTGSVARVGTERIKGILRKWSGRAAARPPAQPGIPGVWQERYSVDGQNLMNADGSLNPNGFGASTTVARYSTDQYATGPSGRPPIKIVTSGNVPSVGSSRPGYTAESQRLSTIGDTEGTGDAFKVPRRYDSSENVGRTDVGSGRGSVGQRLAGYIPTNSLTAAEEGAQSPFASTGSSRWRSGTEQPAAVVDTAWESNLSQQQLQGRPIDSTVRKSKTGGLTGPLGRLFSSRKQPSVERTDSYYAPYNASYDADGKPPLLTGSTRVQPNTSSMTYSGPLTQSTRERASMDRRNSVTAQRGSWEEEDRELVPSAMVQTRQPAAQTGSAFGRVWSRASVRGERPPMEGSGDETTGSQW